MHDITFRHDADHLFRASTNKNTFPFFLFHAIGRVQNNAIRRHDQWCCDHQIINLMAIRERINAGQGTEAGIGLLNCGNINPSGICAGNPLIIQRRSCFLQVSISVYALGL